MSCRQKWNLPEKPKWSTLFIAAGKKDKVNKIDIVGFLNQQGPVEKRRYRLNRSERFFLVCCSAKNQSWPCIANDQERKDKK